MIKGRGLLTAVAVIGLSMSMGCLFGGSSSVKREGSYVAPETLNRIEPGKSKKAYVVALLGQPTEKKEIEPGHELWKYTYKEKAESSGYVFLIFGGSDEKETGGKVFVEFTDDTVSKTWRG
jgi:outer membrane protein assembly factor BamE (lipoprotein component of BamABCDE complex)